MRTGTEAVVRQLTPPRVGAWLQRWDQVRDAAEYIEQGRAELMMGKGWRCQREANGDIVVVLVAVSDR